MKLITAIIKPFKLDDVRAALSEIGNFDILVRADDGLEALPLPHDHVIVPYDSATKLLIIDLEESDQPLVMRWSEIRRICGLVQGPRMQVAGPEVFEGNSAI